MNTRLYQTTNLVKEVLEEKKRARNSDTYLYLQVQINANHNLKIG